MSNIKVTDKRGGNYQAEIEFTYGECERLPFNILRRINAKLTTLPNAGVIATAGFNIRSPGESAAFLEMLEMFGEDGSYVHGSAADPSSLSRTSPGENGGAILMSVDDDDMEEEGTLNDMR